MAFTDPIFLFVFLPLAVAAFHAARAFAGGRQALAVAVLASLAAGPPSAAIYGYAVLLGLGYSATASLIPAMVSDRFGGRHFGAIVGMGLMGSAVGSALGPWMAGYLFDLTGTYMMAFAIAAGCGVAAGAAGWRARVLRVRR